MKKRASSKRFDFEYEYYEGAHGEVMLHLKIYANSPIQVDLWLDEKDQEKLKEILNAAE